MPKKKSNSYVHRSSVDGRFVKESFAKKHPSITEKEKVKNPKKKK